MLLWVCIEGGDQCMGEGGQVVAPVYAVLYLRAQLHMEVESHMVAWLCKVGGGELSFSLPLLHYHT